MNPCTWVDCGVLPTVEVLDKQQRAWAHLCAVHKDQFEIAMGAGDVKKILGAWARAHGTAETFRRRITGR